MMAWKSTADSVSSFSSRIDIRFFGGEGATLNRSFLAASFWTGDGATLNRRVFFGDDGASSTTGVTGPRRAADRRDTTSGSKL